MNATEDRSTTTSRTAALRRPPRVGVFGHYGERNLGDEAIIESIVTRVRNEWRDAQIVAFSIDPQDTAQRYGIQAHPIRQASGRARYSEMEQRIARRLVAGAEVPTIEAADEAPPVSLLDRIASHVPKGRLRTRFGKAVRGTAGLVREGVFLARSLWRVRRLDAMFISGSNQFLDNFGGPWGFPYTLLKWSLLCRLVGCRVYFVSAGAGPLEEPLSHRMARTALRLSDYASFRDEGSMRLIERRVAQGVGSIVPDLAHGLGFVQRGRPLAAGAGALCVGINPMPIYDPRFWPQHDAAKYQRYVREQALFALALLRQGHEVRLYSTHFPDVDVALDIVAQMRSLGLPQGTAAPTIQMPKTVQELMSTIVDVDVVVATRFHGILLALHALRPVIGVCYFQKSHDLLRRFGQDEYAIAVDDLDAEKLAQKFARLAQNRSALLERIRQEDLQLQAELERQYGELFSRLRRRLG
jgi:polysaccharide pyruvyl transferase WcaK-like protein